MDIRQLLFLYIHLQMQSLCLALSTSFNNGGPSGPKLVDNTGSSRSGSGSSSSVSNSCIFRRSDMAYCATQNNIARIPDESKSYGFGFGTVDDAEAMCR